jgi:hypothetical protein
LLEWTKAVPVRRSYVVEPDGSHCWPPVRYRLSFPVLAFLGRLGQEALRSGNGTQRRLKRSPEHDETRQFETEANQRKQQKSNGALCRSSLWKKQGKRNKYGCDGGNAKVKNKTEPQLYAEQEVEVTLRGVEASVVLLDEPGIPTKSPDRDTAKDGLTEVCVKWRLDLEIKVAQLAGGLEVELLDEI